MSDAVDSLIELWLEGSLDPEGESKLDSWLQENPQHMRRFVEANIREQMMRELDGSVFQDSEMPQVVSYSATKARENVRTRHRWKRFAVPLSLTACLFVLAAGFWWFQNDAGTSMEPFLSIVAVHNTDTDFRAGDRLADQTIQFERGSLRLLFDDGVEVTLQGPARYELIAPGRTRLLTGLLTAAVPPGAEGFQVVTPTAEVVDLGTAFGIELSNDGAAKVSVFDGEVEVTPTRLSTTHKTQTQSTTRATEGQTIRVSAKAEVELSELDTSPFENVWPIASGIAESTGAFEFAPPWPRPMGLVQSDSKIFVLPEGYAQTVDTPIPVNITEAGKYEEFSQLTDTNIAAGTRVKSFLLQFRPIDRGDGGRAAKPKRPAPDELKRIVGEITFDQPVIGIVVRGNDLRATDRVFSRRGGQVPQKGRALELFGSPRDDVIVLGENRRTIKLDLAAFGIFSDQVRVIVGQSLQTTE